MDKYVGFYIEDPIGNNEFSYEDRENKNIYVPRLIEGTLDDVALGDKIVFNEIDEGNEIKAKGLKIWLNIRLMIKQFMFLTTIIMLFILG